MSNHFLSPAPALPLIHTGFSLVGNGGGGFLTGFSPSSPIFSLGVSFFSAAGFDPSRP